MDLKFVGPGFQRCTFKRSQVSYSPASRLLLTDAFALPPTIFKHSTFQVFVNGFRLRFEGFRPLARAPDHRPIPTGSCSGLLLVSYAYPRSLEV